jgi:hypothetical protein
MFEHTASFEYVNPANASLNVEMVKQSMKFVDEALAVHDGSKIVFVSTWPGLYVDVGKYPPVANGGEPTPKTNDQWRDALRSHFGFNQAMFLSVAEANAYWYVASQPIGALWITTHPPPPTLPPAALRSYGGTWYGVHTGMVDCPENRNSCPTPPEWYPDLDKPLGAPLGKRVEVAPYVFRREFEHATVHLDLNMPNRSKTTYA